MSDALLLILAYTLFLGFTLFFRGRSLQGPWWFLLRSFLPNWRFYHRVGTLPLLFLRTADDSGQWSHWQGDVPRAQRRLRHLLHNAQNNRLLLDQSLIEHLYADCRDLTNVEDVERLVSYRLVCEVTQRRAQALHPQAKRVQFEVRVMPPYGAPTAETATLTSPVMRISTDHESDSV